MSTPSRVLDPDRLAVLAATHLLDSAPEESFDRLTRLVTQLLRVPTAVVTLVTQDRQFFKSAIGVSESLETSRATPLSHSFCVNVVADGRPLIVPDARIHPLVSGNPAIGDFGVIAYLGVPLTTNDGHTLGALCAMDSHPRDWPEDTVRLLQDLAAAATAEIELRLLATHFQKSYLELRALELQRDEMVQMLVHDLRNPLTSVIAGLEFIGEAPHTPTADVALAMGGALALHEMISDILDVSKAQAVGLGLQRTATTPRTLVTTAQERVGHLAAQRSVTVTSELETDVEVHWDGPKLIRVLVNLLSNAIQHTPPGGRVQIKAAIDSTTGGVQLSVSDTRDGIPAHVLPRIFDNFASSGRRRGGYASTGLGLAFSKRVVEAHGGSIHVESQIGAGTTFWLSLPA